jgi:hypothetical protein
MTGFSTDFKEKCSLSESRRTDVNGNNGRFDEMDEGECCDSILNTFTDAIRSVKNEYTQ